MVQAVGPNSRDSSAGVRPPRTRSTICRLNSGVYRTVFSAIVNPSKPYVEVSTQAGQLHLAAAGAECVAITSVAGHFCIDAFKASSVLPVVDMISEVNRVIEQRAFERIGILGTRTVMETRLYGGVSCVEVVPPSGQDLEDVHQAYVAMAASGIVTEAQSAVFAAVGKQLFKESGVEAIMLGGTDLALAFNERGTEFPLIDCAGIHADAIAKLATT
ncbi:MAG: aspartate/glutamate racemase family protein [Acidobacteria bacterium]|nr:MAG: aspartate/glutamate racemase family protein [Acidobacteriota bacterium]